MNAPAAWPRGGAWILTGTSVDSGPAGVAGTPGDPSTYPGWQVAAAAIAAASPVRVALVIAGDTTPPGDLLTTHIATWVRAGDGGSDPLTVADVAGLVQALRLTHGLVLIAAGAGLLVPLGRGGWTLADLAVALRAPAVVVAGGGPDATNHTTLALGALSGLGIPACVVTLGADHDGLPVSPAGRIPAGAADSPADFAGAAAGWLDPILHATDGPARSTPPRVRKKPAPATREGDGGEKAGGGPGGGEKAGGETGGGEKADGETGGRTAGGRTVSGRRVVIALMAVFLCAVIAACGLAFLNLADGTTAGDSGHRSAAVRVVPWHPAPAPRISGPVTTPRATLRATLPATTVCPQYKPGVVVTRPGPAARRRVDAAWERIETWLAAHAPKSRRALRPPARAARIDQVQRQMSVPFPADLIASLSRHDGVDAAGFSLPPFYSPMAVTQIAADWVLTCGVAANLGTATTGDWWHPAYVPFATASDGGCLLTDQRSGGHGRVGEFYPEDGTSFDSWPASVAELLEKTATTLETGRPYGGRYRPKVVGGTLDWDVI